MQVICEKHETCKVADVCPHGRKHEETRVAHGSILTCKSVHSCPAKQLVKCK